MEELLIRLVSDEFGRKSNSINANGSGVINLMIIILFLGVYGTIAAPYEPLTDREFRTLGNDADDDTEVVEARLPGSTNLNEKALPISRLYVIETDSLPGNQNLKERTQIRAILPGTQNLAEKSIPDYVLKRMANPENRRISSHPDFEEIPIQ
uniref:Uncharacterized protein n=1 Tax=Vespula pensylvanica TaxID=30213 RepID=A0A834U3T0_VESPE|nr:hypothetical protein H0235_012016 [Vespula pensylvanica]